MKIDELTSEGHEQALTFAPVNAAVTVSGANINGVNFTAQAAVGGTLSTDATVSGAGPICFFSR